MTRRCTRSSCRREFTVGAAAPVRCPYCGQRYPRVMPDARRQDAPFGYGVELSPQELSALQMREILLREIPAIRRVTLYSMMLRQTFRIDLGLSQREAWNLSQRLCRCGIAARVVPGRELAGSQVHVVRLRQG